MKHTEIYDALLLSPYRGVQRLIHNLMLQLADGRNISWPSVEWLAQHAGCSRRYVEKTLSQMRADGVIQQVGKTANGVIRYFIAPEPQFGSDPNHSSVPPEPQFGQKTKEDQVEDQQTSRASGTRVEQEQDMIGELPPDEPEQEQKKKPRTVPDRNTQAWCLRRFSNEATKHGHPRYNQGIVRREIKRLRDDGYSYEEIDVLIAGWFWKSELFIRNSANNLATLFVHGMPETEKRMADRIRTMRSGVDPDAYFDEQQALLREAMKGTA